MHQLSVCLLSLALRLASVEAQFALGRCPYQPVVDNFDSATYIGDWYEYSKYLSADQAVTECTKATYSANGQLFDVEVESITLGITTSRNGQLKLADPSSTEAKFTLSWLENEFDGIENDQTNVNYQVLDTDYTNYAIIYNCVDFLFTHYTELNIYTRSREPDQAVIDGVYDTLRERRIGTFLLTRTNQVNCDSDS